MGIQDFIPQRCDRSSIAGVIAILMSVSAFGEVGVTPTKIILGRSTDMSGVAKQRAEALARGAQLVFDQTNENGGVLGRRIEVLSLDDGYDPRRTFENTIDLIENKKVFAIFQTYGTAAHKENRKLYAKFDIPAVALGMTTEEARVTVEKNVFFTQPSMKNEMHELLNYAVKKLDVKSIRIGYQHDASGIDFASTTGSVGKELGVPPIQSVSFGRTETAISTATVKSLVQGKPEAIALSGHAPVLASVIRAILQEGENPIFLLGSKAITGEFLRLLGNASPRIYFSSGSPVISSQNSLKIVQNFMTLAKAKGIPAEESAFTGYLSGLVMVEALKIAGSDLTRDKFRKSLESFDNKDFGGISITFNSTSHRGSSKAFVGKLEGHHFVPIQD